MSLGNTYLRPQLLTRTDASEELRILNLTIELMSLLARDQAADGEAAQKMAAGAQAAANRFFEEISRRMSRAEGGFKTWFQPVIDIVKSFQGLGEGEIAEGMLALIGLIKKVLEDLSVEDIERKINELLNVLTDDLGLTQDHLINFLRDLIDTFIESLNEDYLAGNNTEASRRCFLIGSRIAAIRSFLLEQIPQADLGITRSQVISLLTTELRERNWDEIREKLLEGIAPLTASVTTITDLLSGLDGGVDASVDVSVGERNIDSRNAEGEMSWYATWFLDSRWTGGYRLVADRMKLGDEDFANRMSFKEMDAEFMEKWAHLTSAFTDFGEVLLHGASIERGDFLTNLLQMVFQGLKGTLTLAGADEKSEKWAKTFEVFDNYLFEYLLNSTLIWSTIGSYEKNPGTFIGRLLANFMPDAAESALYGVWSHSAREFFLSLFTLINHDQENAPNAENYKQTDGFVLAWAEAGIWLGALLPRIYPWFGGKKHFGFPSHGGAGEVFKLISYWLLTVGYSFAFSAIGVEVAGAISGKKDDTYYERGGWQIPIWAIAKFPLYWFIWWDGATGGGTLGIDSDEKRTLVDMPGYPDPETSPYKLPYPKDMLFQCVQSHHGIWSHNIKTSQIYSLDFSHDEGDPVLAMRGGTVVYYEDTMRDNSTGDWNNIIIKHDDPTEILNPHPEHDKDHQGIATTYAQYGHGRQYGVSHAFATRGIPADKIQGTRVQAGDLIMYAGDTGMSAYNHLHVHVYTSPPTHFPYRTIPWVVKDLERKKLLGFIPLGRQGVPRAFDYYPSTNERREIAELALYHPKHLGGKSRDSGSNWIQLENAARDRDDWYKDHHILIWYDNADGHEVHEYKKIIAYEEDNRRATIEGKWTQNSPPPNDSRYTIGAPPYSEANKDFHKRFAYLAPVDESNTPQPFADRDPYVYASVAIYQKRSLDGYGRVQSGGAIGGNTMVLENNASDQVDAYVGHHLIIRRAGRYIQYKRVSAYDKDTKTLTIEGTWDKTLVSGASGDSYTIGAAPYGSDDANTGAGFIAPQAGEDVQDFADGRAPYAYNTY